MANWNKSYLTVAGVFTGSNDTTYKVVLQTNDDLKWQTQVDGIWSAETTILDAAWSTNTAITLSDGITITMTRSLKSSYNDNDAWEFTAYAILKLTPGVTSSHDNLHVIEVGTRRDLVAINSTSGDVSTIQDFEGAAPQKQDSIATIGQTTSIDTCSRNKELYIATGNNNPQFLGYTKNNGYNGTQEQFRFIQDRAYKNIDNDSLQSKSMDDFVVLRGDGANQGASRLYVGIIYNESRFYAWNTDTSKVYTYRTDAPVIRIRPNPAELSSGNINGVCILTQNSADNYINALEYWSFPISGSEIGRHGNRDSVSDISAPEQNSDLTTFSDFLIVSTLADYTSSSAEFHGIFAAQLDDKESERKDYLFKLDKIINEPTIASTDWVAITPSLTSTGSVGNNKFVQRMVHRSGGWANPVEGPGDPEAYVNTDVFSTPSLDSPLIACIQDISLALGGYDSNGANPMIHFTAKIEDLTLRYDTWVRIGAQGAAGATWSEEDTFGPFWQDNNGKIWAVSWVTFSLPVSNTGSVPTAKLLHLAEWDNPTAFWNNYSSKYSSWMVDNVDAPPAGRPLFAASNTKGRKYIMVGDSGNSGIRQCMSYFRSSSPYKAYTFSVPFLSGTSHLWNTNSISVFPNKWSSIYTKLPSGSEVSSETQPSVVTSILECDTDIDSTRWAIGDIDHQVPMGATFPTSTSKMFAMASRKGWGAPESRVSKYTIDATSAVQITNDIGGLAGWLSYNTPTFISGTEWQGGTTKKSWYKISLVYDGYQESTLMDETITIINSGNVFTEAINLEVRLDADFELPDRVNSIAVYRADDQDNTAVEPSGLYRFIEEIPLEDFNYDDATSKYTVTVSGVSSNGETGDGGHTQGSYGAINGISETLRNLDIQYGTCTQLNGYMFIGNANHRKFDNAENHIFRSQPGKFSIFDWSKDFTQVDFIPKAMVGFMGKLYIFGANKLAILNPETLIIEDEISGIGCVGPKAIQVTPSGLFWFDKTNIYTASPQIRKIGTSILTEATHGWANLTDATKESAVSGYDANRQTYLIFFKNTDTRVWSYFTSNNRWDLWETTHEVYDTVMSSDGYSILLMEEGRICKYLGGTNKRDWEFHSKKLSFGSDTTYKKVKVLKADGTSRSNTSVTYKTNANDSSWQAGTDNSDKYGATWTGKSIKIASGDSKLRWFQAKIMGTNNQSGSDMQVKSVGMIYKPKSPK